MSPTKREILETLIASLEADLATLIQSAREAHAAATHEEGRAEDQYDTRGLEASYLAGAQSKRAAELQKQIQTYRHLELREFKPGDRIAATALIELESGKSRTLCLLVPGSGGSVVRMLDRTIQVLSVTSPLGEELVGRNPASPSEREFEVELSATQMREYRIVSVW